MKRYEEHSDAIPHEVNVLVLSESEECFGESFGRLLDAIRSRLSCETLLVQEFYHDLEDLSNRERLARHGVWLVHHDCVDPSTYPHLHHYLETSSFPDGTAVVICADGDEVDVPALRERYGAQVAMATEREALLGYLHGFFEAVNPCSQPGLEYILRWNQGVCDDLEVV